MRTDPVPPAPVEIVFTPEFKRNLRQLAKKYRQIKADVQPLLSDLMQGQTPGDQIPGVQHTVFKVRIKNADSRKGKSGGYRIIYSTRACAIGGSDNDLLENRTSRYRTPGDPPDHSGLRSAAS